MSGYWVYCKKCGVPVNDHNNAAFPRIAELEAKLEKQQAVIDAAKGLSHGTDWNNGNHATKYRYALERAIKALEDTRLKGDLIDQMEAKLEETRRLAKAVVDAGGYGDKSIPAAIALAQHLEDTQ